MNRRDFFALTAVGLADTAQNASHSEIKVQLEALRLQFRNELTALTQKLQYQSRNASATIGSVKEACANQARRVDSLQFKQLIIFSWLAVLTFITGIDLITASIFFIV